MGCEGREGVGERGREIWGRGSVTRQQIGINEGDGIRNRRRRENTERRDGGTGRIMSWIEKPTEEAVLPPYTKCDSVTER